MNEAKRIIYDYAIRLIGTRYHWGGESAIAGFDCSGLVIELLKASGEWPHGLDATAQGIHDRMVPVSVPDVKDFGSLYFFGRSSSSISHVAFGLGFNHLLEAGGGGSDTISEQVAVKRNAVVRVRPNDFRKDLVSVLLPDYKIFKGER